MKRIVSVMVGTALCGLAILIALRQESTVSIENGLTEMRMLPEAVRRDASEHPLQLGQQERTSYRKEELSIANSTRSTAPAVSSVVASTHVIAPEAITTRVFRRLRPTRVIESRNMPTSDTQEVVHQHLVETGGKYAHVVIEQRFQIDPAGVVGTLKSETAFAADALLLKIDDPKKLDQLVAQREIQSFRRIARNVYRVRLARPTLDGITAAKALLTSRIQGVTSIEPDYVVFTAQEPEEVAPIDRNGDGIIDDELHGAMSVDEANELIPTLSPELVLADVEQRLANVPLGSRVLTFDRPLSDARPQIGYRPYLMEQNFLLIAAPYQYATIYPQPPYTSGYPSNGTIYVRSLSGDSGMKIRHKDGLPFSLYQIDLSEYSTVFARPSTVTFVGYRKDGTTVSHSFTLDGRIDGTGPIVDFETFTFPPSFTNLDRVEIPTEGFMMDNLVVAPSGEETPLPPPPALPVLYDITWDGFPHELDQVTAVNGAYAPSTVNFGAPRVKSQIGPMTGPALELRGTGTVYEQFTCLVEPGGNLYTLDFDMTMPSGGSLALLFDRTSNLSRIDFSSGGTISSTFGFGGSFSSSSVTHFRFEVDLAKATCRILKNDVVMYSGGFPGRTQYGELRQIRFSATVSSSEIIGIDNVRITGDVTTDPTPSGPRALITPLVLNFPTTTSGMTSTRGIQIENIGSEPLSVSSIRTDSPNFQTDTSASLNLIPGQRGTVYVTFVPQSTGAHSGNLTLVTNESTANTKAVALSGTATGVPAINLTPKTLHITMLADDVGTQHFTIHNTGTGTLQWRFITAPPASLPAALTPNDVQFGSLWGMKAPSANTGGIEAVRAWSITTDASRVRVAVVDTGVDYTHHDLADNIYRNTGEVPGNGIDDDNNGFVDDVHGWNFYTDNADPMDDHGHGTHVSGTIGAAGNNSLGISGVAWKASIVPLKFLGAQGFGYTSDAITCVDYATMLGCRVINASWGGGGYSTLLRDAIEEFTVSNNALFVAAAGNSFRNNDQAPSFPASYDVSGIIAVAATDSYDKLASFSNWGKNSVDIAAPGVGILSCAPGNKYSVASGTSMAAPHVSGSVALLFSYHSALTNSECLQRLTANADFPPALAEKVNFGGRLNVYTALSSSVVPWIRPAVWSGSVQASESFKVPLSVDTHGLAPGEYTTSLALQTNDPAQPRAEIPVQLTVRRRHRFNEWSAEQFAVNNLLFEGDAASTWAASADPDNDGSSNLLEFLTGADPSTPSALPVDGQVDPAFGRTFRFQTRSDLSGVQYRIEWTDDLSAGIWRVDGIQTRLVQTDPTRNINLWDAYLPDSGNLPALFFRIVASEQ